MQSEANNIDVYLKLEPSYHSLTAWERPTPCRSKFMRSRISFKLQARRKDARSVKIKRAKCELSSRFAAPSICAPYARLILFSEKADRQVDAISWSLPPGLTVLDLWSIVVALWDEEMFLCYGLWRLIKLLRFVGLDVNIIPKYMVLLNSVLWTLCCL